MTVKKSPKSHFQPVFHFGMRDNTHDRHFAKQLADLTINWGRLEHQLFLLTLIIDKKRGPALTAKFFDSHKPDVREKVAKSEIEDVMKKAYPKFKNSFEKLLSKLKDLRDRRNPLAHGLWERIDERSFSVRPMRLNKAKVIASPITVDMKYVSSINYDIDQTMQLFGSLSIAMMADRFLEKREAKRKAAISKK